MAIKIEMLRCFATVARTGNLSNAADILARTPSAVSMMLKQLEENLGEPLFETDRKSKLTTLGQFVLEQAERELAQFDGTIQEILDFAKARSGRVRLAAVPSIASTILPDAIFQYLEKYPDIFIEVRDMDSASVIRELSRNRIDIGIASTQGHSTPFHTETILSDAFGVICHANSSLAQLQRPLTWQDLSQHRLIANSLSKSIDIQACRDLHATAGLVVQNITSLMAMIKNQIGITILPEMTAKTAASADIMFLKIDDFDIRRNIEIIKNSEAPTSPAARILESTIIQCIKEYETGHRIDLL